MFREKTVGLFEKALLSFLLAGFVFFAQTSCQVGLGEQVDVGTPSAEINYPSSESIIKGAFRISGKCSDDLGVSSLEISISSSEATASSDKPEGKRPGYVGTITIAPDNNGANNTAGSWHVDIDPENFCDKKLKDGSYIIDVVAKDNSKHQSSQLSLVVSLDNHAPVFIISSPSSTDIQTPTPYGRKLTIAGALADDHVISEMNISVLDSNGNDILDKPLQFTNVEPSSISAGQIIAQYNEAAAAYLLDNTKYYPGKDVVALHENYVKIYSSNTETADIDTANPMTKPFYCKIELVDNAAQFTGSDTDDKRGNSTTVYYNNDKIYDDILSTNGYSLTADDLKKILNGTSTKEITPRAAAATDSAIEDIIELLANAESSSSAFSINPDAAPSYDIMGIDITSTNPISVNKIKAKNSITYQVKAGRDNVAVKPWTFVYYFCRDENFTDVAYTIVENEQNYLETTGLEALPEENFAVQAEPYLKENGSTTSYTGTIVVPESFNPTEQYYIRITGQDLENEDLYPKGLYGFEVASSGLAPTVEFDQFNAAYPNKNLTADAFYKDPSVTKSDTSMVFSGFAETDANAIKYVTVKLSITDSSDSSKSFGNFQKTFTNLEQDVSVKDKRRFRWSFDVSEIIEAGPVELTEAQKTVLLSTENTSSSSGSFLYKFIIEAAPSDGEENIGIVQRQITVDPVLPTITLNEVTPVVETKDAQGQTVLNINGVISITGSVTQEANLENVYYTIDSNETRVFQKIADTEELTDKFEIGARPVVNKTFCSTAKDVNNDDVLYYTSTGEQFVCVDNAPFVITLYAVDKAGNETSTKSVTYMLNQATDAPKFESSNFTDGISLTEISTDANLFDRTPTGSKVTAQVIDDDAIGSIEYNIYTVEGRSPTAEDRANPEKYTKKIEENSGKFENIGKSPYNLSIQLPDDEGRYLLEIIATDTKQETDYGKSKLLAKTFVAVDASIPAISINYKSGTFVTENPVITVTVSDTANIASLKRYGLTENPETHEQTVNTVADDDKYSVIQTGAFNSTNEMVINNTIETSDSGTVRYLVKDTYGKENFIDFAWKIDKKAPTFTVTSATRGPNVEELRFTPEQLQQNPKGFTDFDEADVRVFNMTKRFELKGTVKDVQSGLERPGDDTDENITNSARIGRGLGDSSKIKGIFAKVVRQGADGKYYTTIGVDEVETVLPEAAAGTNYFAEIASLVSGDRTLNEVLEAKGWVSTDSAISITRTSPATEYIDDATWRADIDATALKENEKYIIFLAAIDNAGYVSAIKGNPSSMFIIKPDGTAPVIHDIKIGDLPLESFEGETWSKEVIKIKGSVTEKNLDHMVYSISQTGTGGSRQRDDLVEQIRWTDEAAGGDFEFPDIDETGTYTIEIAAIDKAGRESRKGNIIVKIDTSAPDLITTDLSRDDETTIINKIFDTDVARFVVTGNHEGTYKVHGSIDDGVGVGKDGAKVFYSTNLTAPDCNITGEKETWEGQLVSKGWISVELTAEGFDANIPVVEATQKIHFLTMDRLGNVKVTTYDVKVDLSAPKVTRDDAKFVHQTETEAVSYRFKIEDHKKLKDISSVEGPVTVVARWKATSTSEEWASNSTKTENKLVAGTDFTISKTEGKTDTDTVAYRTITINTGAHHNGYWTFSLSPNDEAGHSITDDNRLTAEIQIDPEKPVITLPTDRLEALSVEGATRGNNGDGVFYFKNNLSIDFAVNATDTITGVKSVKYIVVKGRKDLVGGALPSIPAADYRGGSAESWLPMNPDVSDSSKYTATIASLIQKSATESGDYTIFVKAEDNIGLENSNPTLRVASNTSAIEVFHIFGDNELPALEETVDPDHAKDNANTSFYPGAFTLTGTVKDKSLKTLEVYDASCDVTGYSAAGLTFTPQVSVNNDGVTYNWTINQTSVPASGSVTFTYNIRAIDLAGNETDILGRKVTIDRSAPAVTIKKQINSIANTTTKPVNSQTCTFEGTVVDAAPSSGLNGNLLIWIDGTETFAGAENAKTAYDNAASKSKKEVVPAANGSWNVTFDDITDGIYYLHVYVKDKANNISYDNSTTEDNHYKFIVDTTPATSTISANKNFMKLEGDNTFTPNSSIAWDTAESVPHYYTNEAFTLSGTVKDTYGFSRSGVKITVNGEDKTSSLTGSSSWTWTNASTGYDWSYAQTLTDGTYNYVLQITDTAGNSTSSTYKFTVTVDHAAPVISINSPAKDAKFKTAELVLDGTVSDSGIGQPVVTYKLLKKSDSTQIYPATGTKEANVIAGSWLDNVTLSTQTSYELVVTATDKLGNTVTKNGYYFDYDETAPVLKAGAQTVTSNKTAAGGHDWVNSTIVAIASAAKDNETELASVSYTTGTATPDANSSWIPLTKGATAADGYTAYTWNSVPVSSEGLNKIWFKATDKVGNDSTPVSVEIYLDTVLPEVSIDTDISSDSFVYRNASTASSVDIYATSNDSNSGTKKIYLTKQGSTDEIAYVENPGENTSKKLTIPIDQFKTSGVLKDGTYTFNVWSEDNAGNKARADNSIKIIIDTVSPVIEKTNFNLTDSINIFAGETDTYSSNLNENEKIYALSGKWKDVNGSGTKDFKYKWSDDADWTTVSSLSSTTAEAQFSNRINIHEGKNLSLSLKVTDKAGNESSTVTFTGLSIDFAKPEINMDQTVVVGSKYGKDAVIEIKGFVTDTCAMPTETPFGITVTGTNGTASVGSGGITWTTPTPPSPSPYVHVERENTSDPDRVNFSVKLTVDDSVPDGVWTFTVAAVDINGNAAVPVTKTTTIDKAPPTLTLGFEETPVLETTGATTYSNVFYFNQTKPLSFTVTAEDGTNGTGVSNVYYVAVKGHKTSILGIAAADKVIGDPAGTWEQIYQEGSSAKWTSTVKGFNTSDDGEYTLFVKARDNVGNECDVQYIHLVADKTEPALIEDQSGISVTNNNSFTTGNFTLQGTINDTNLVSVTSTGSKTGSGSEAESVNWSDGNTTWSIVQTGVPATGDASYKYTITAVDRAGNESKIIDRTVTIDRIGPEAKVTKLANKDATTGVIASSNENCSVEGTAADNEGGSGLDGDVTVWYDEIAEITSVNFNSATTAATAAKRIYIATPSSTGAWNVTINNIPSGNWYLHVAARDKAGNLSCNAVQQFRVDKDAPVSTLSIKDGTASGANAVTLFKKDEHYVPATGTYEAGTKYYERSGSAPDYTYNIKTGLNPGDDVTDYYLYVFTSNADSSDILWSEAPETLISKDGFTLHGTVTDNYGFTPSEETVFLSVNNVAKSFTTSTSGFTWTSSSSGYDWTYTQPKADGTYIYKLTLTDDAGNQKALTFSVQIDSTGPKLTVASPTNNQNVVAGDLEDGKLTFRGIANDIGSGVASITYTLIDVNNGNAVVDSNAAVLSEDGSWVGQSGVTTSSKYKLVIEAKDYLELSSSQEIEFKYDSIRPTLKGFGITKESKVENGKEYFKTATLSIVAYANDAETGISAVTYTTDGANWLPLAKGALETSGEYSGLYKYTSETVLIGEGENKITLKAMDEFGNESQEIASATSQEIADSKVMLSKTIYLDTKSPVIDNASAQSSNISSATKSTDAKINFSVKDNAVSTESGIKKVYLTNASETQVGTASTKTDASSEIWTDSITIPAATFTADGDYQFYLIAEDGAGNSSKSGLISITYDTTAPAITVTNVTADAANLVTKKTILDTNNNHKFENDKHYYTLNGTWVDPTSGTQKLYYSTMSGITSGAEITGNPSTGWKEITDVVTNSKVTTSWSVDIEIAQGDGNCIAVMAADNSGNKSTPVAGATSFTDLIYDFSVPVTSEITQPTGTTEKNGINYVKYTGSAQTVTLYATVTDGWKMNSEDTDVVITKDGSTVASANYTTYGISVEKTSVDTQTAKLTVTMNVGTTAKAEGLWTFSINGKDAAGRESAAESTSITIDTVVPTFVAYNDSTTPFKVNNEQWTSSTYFKSETLPFKGGVKENGTGIANVYYYLIPAGAAGSAPSAQQIATGISGISGSYTPAISKGDNVEYALTASGFAKDQGAVVNKLYLVAEDIAGNLSAVQDYTVHVDNEAPAISSVCFTVNDEDYQQARGTVLSNGKNDITLYGLVSDKASGLTDTYPIVTKINGTDQTLVITYTDAEINEESSYEVVSGSTYKAYSEFTDKTVITGWKTTIAKNNIKSGKVEVKATDKAGNGDYITLFNFDLDSVGPEVTINSPAANSQVNGKMEIAGTAKDDHSLVSVALYYSATDSSASIEDESNVLWDVPKTGESVNPWNFPNINLKTDEGKILGTTIDYADDKNAVLYFKVVAKDSAGNTSIVVRPLNVVPKSDRPVISLTYITDPETSVALLKNKSVVGGYTDDDGTIDTLWYRLDDEWNGTAPTTTAPNGWTSVEVTNGSWDFDLGSAPDGMTTVYFFCKDAAGTEYSTLSEEPLNRPLIKYKSATAPKDNTTGITYKTDTEAPEISELKLAKEKTTITTPAASYTTENWLSTSTPFGGNYKTMYLKIVVKEGTGLKTESPIIISIGKEGETSSSIKATVEQTSHSGSDYTFIAGPINFGELEKENADDDNTNWELEDGVYSLSVTVEDASGAKGQSTKSFVIDNTAPTVEITYPQTRLQDAITGAVTMSGRASDGVNSSGVKTIKWAIPKNSEKNNMDSYAGWTTLGSTTTISVPFESAIFGDDECILTYANSNYSSVLDGHEINEGYWKVPVYFYVEDELGNYKIDTDQYVVADRLSSRPTVTLVSPSANDQNKYVSGGNIYFAGTARDDSSIESVRIQLDMNHDGEFDEEDYDILRSQIDNKTGLIATDYSLVEEKYSVAFGTYDYYTTYYGASHNEVDPNTAGWQEGITPVTNYFTREDWYLKATGTNNWKFMFNSEYFTTGETSGTKKYLDGTSVGEGNPILGIRICAYDDVNSTRGWSAPIDIEVDSNAPTMSPLKLVQYASGNSGTTTIELEYTPGMYISTKTGNGKWYLTGTVTDDTAVTTFVPNTVAGSTISVDYNNYVTGINTPTVTINAPITTSTTADGKHLATLQFYDIQNASCGVSLQINVDNTAPSMYKTDGNPAISGIASSLRLVSSEANVDNAHPIKNEDQVYTFGDTVTENGSGLKFIAFWFERVPTTVSAATPARVYSPMFETNNRTNIGTNTSTNGDFYINTDGFATLYLTGTRTTESVFTSSLISGNNNIRTGGLVKIGGAYRKISKVDGDTVTLSEGVSTSFTTAEFVYAQVVDHELTEGPTGSDYTTVQNDDGDGLIETLHAAGDTYTWTASVFSDRIVDGKIQLHVIAVDKAGNLNHGYTESSVENHAPRMSRMLLGTDLDGNGRYDFDSSADIIQKSTSDLNPDTENGVMYGEFTYYSTLKSNKEQSIVTINKVAGLDITASNAFKIKNGMIVIPEFTGTVNGKLWYAYNNENEESPTRTTVTAGAAGTSNLTSKAALTSATNPIVHSRNVDEGKKGISYYINENIGAVVLTSGLPADSDSLQWFTFTFWDETEETTRGTDSQVALLKFPVIMDQVDNVAPRAYIKPFFWKLTGKDKATGTIYNSLYNGDPNEGHIELENDWPYLTTAGAATTAANAATSGQYDKDPKVSGKIRIIGSAYDDTKLKTISIKIPGFNLGGGAGNFGTMATFATDASHVSGWTLSTATMDDNGYEFSLLEDSGVTVNGHQVTWLLELDTSKHANIAAADVAVEVKAVDYGSGSGNVSPSSTTQTKETITSADAAANDKASVTENYNTAGVAKINTVEILAGKKVTTAGEYTPYYRMDIVPYITDVETTLAKKSTGGTTTYSRTALGHYVINSTETITLMGFNLDTKEISAANQKTDKYSYAVNGINAVNNYNNDDACGSYLVEGFADVSKKTARTIEDDDYENCYNRKPNVNNNKLLNDDLYFDVWVTNNEAATSTYPALKYPAMHISPAGDRNQIGFGFVRGTDSVSFPANGKSYLWYQTNRKDYVSTNFVYDAKGVAHTVSIGLDAQFDTGIAGRMNYNNSSWYSNDNKGTTNIIKQWDKRYNIALESIGIPNSVYVKGTQTNVSGGQGIIDVERFNTPSIAAATHGDNTAIYIMYYDNQHDQIRFRYGLVPNTGTNRFTTQWGTTSYTQYGLLNDSNSERQRHGTATSSTTNDTAIASDTRGNNDTYASHGMFEASVDNYALVTGRYYKQENNNTAAFNTGNNGSSICAMDVVAATGNDKTMNDDKVVIIWYDQTTTSLMYIYRENLGANNDNVSNVSASTAAVATGTGQNRIVRWSAPRAILTGKPVQDVTIKADKLGGIHIAAYDQNEADLIYMYMNSYNATEVYTCTVDAYSQVGKSITLDVPLNSDGKAVPYISYYAEGMNSLPKLAFLPGGIDRTSVDTIKASIKDGADAKTKLFSQKWEVTLIPTTSALQVSVGSHYADVMVEAFRDADGKITKAKSGTDDGDANERRRYANGTTDLVVGYAIKTNGIGYIETAMRK